MKKTALLLLLCISQFVTAQITKNLGDFSKVKVFDRINVTLIKADENKIVITGNRADEVELVTKNNELKVRMGFTKLLAGDDIEAKLYYKNIDGVEAHEGSFIASSDTFSVPSFDILSKEGATVKLKLDVQKLSSKLRSGGIAELSGKSTIHDANINSGGVLEAKELITEQTEISVSAGGEADIYASKLVEAKTTAGGDITVFGNPEIVDKKTTLGGDITIVK